MTPSESMLLNEQVVSALHRNPYFSSRRVRVQTQDDQVILEGQVTTWFQKQMAQETLLRIDGVRRIDNRLQVV